MSAILVFAEQNDGVVSRAALAALAAAIELKSSWNKSKICVLCLGPGSKNAVQSLGGLGLDSGFYSEASTVEKYRAVAYKTAALAAMNTISADVFVSAATSNGRDFTPRVTAALNAGQASDILAIHSDGTLERALYAGNVLATVEIASDNKVVTVRPTAFDPVAPTGTLDTVSEVSFSVDETVAGSVVGYELARSERPELADATVVVSGGRALQSAENFEKYIFPLADSLGAAVGASRAAVDSGYAPNDWQVGQTGKVVAPQLYIAIGISGAIQHLAGMKDSKVIVAINKDADAPIFEIADYGLVADLYEVVKPLTEAIKAGHS